MELIRKALRSKRYVLDVFPSAVCDYSYVDSLIFSGWEHRIMIGKNPLSWSFVSEVDAWKKAAQRLKDYDKAFNSKDDWEKHS